jgi:MscS family membrane protein
MTLEQIPDFLRDAFARGAIIIAALAGLWLVRYVVIWLLTRPLVHLAERIGMPQLDDKLRDIVTTPVQIAFFGLAVLIIGVGLQLDENGLLFTSRLARTLFIIAIAVAIYRSLEIVAFSRGRLYALTGFNMDEALLPFMRVGLQFIVISFAVVIIVQEWGYDVSALVAGLGLGGLAFSLAASDTIANLFGFSMIVGDRPFVVGDTIRTGDVEGVVERVGLRSTRIRQPDQALVTVPNKTLANSIILNWSRLGKRYINFTLRLSADARVDEVQRVVNAVREMLEIRPRVETDSISVRFTGFGDSWLEVAVRCYVLIVNGDEFSQERETINLEIMKVLAASLAGSEANATVVSTGEMPSLPPEPAHGV